MKSFVKKDVPSDNNSSDLSHLRYVFTSLTHRRMITFGNFADYKLAFFVIDRKTCSREEVSKCFLNMKKSIYAQ